jgi:methylglutaconyl-CoA hydratase
MPTIAVEITTSGIAEITLKRAPAHNALNAQMISELTSALEDLASNEQVRMLCLQGAGKSFCAGADLVWMQQTIESDAKENLNDAMKLSKMLDVLYNFPKPTLAIVSGSAFGGGVGLVACCDIAISHEAARFCLSETKLGLVPATISPYLAQAIGRRALAYLSYTAVPIPAQQALALGLIQEVHASAEELDKRKSQLCVQIIQNGPQALTTAKQLIKRLDTAVLDDALRMELAELIASIRVSQEAQERMLRFLNEKAH